MTVKMRGIARISIIGAMLGLLTSPVLAAPDLDGVWILYRAEKFGRPNLTEEGQLKKRHL